MPTVKLPSGREVDLGDLDADVLGTGGIPSNLQANHPGGWTPAYGAPPNIPDPVASMWQAIGGNIEALPSLFSMGNAYNLFNFDERMGQVQGTPGWEQVNQNLQGMLPDSLKKELWIDAAQRGIQTGDPLSPNSDAAWAQLYGTNQLKQQITGQNQLNALLSQFPGAALFDIMKFLTSPDDVQAALTAANVSAAAPDPRAAAEEEQRKLLEAIAAGKANAGGGPVGSGGVDYSKILDLIKSLGGGSTGGNPKEGTVVGKGPNQTINRGVDATLSNRGTYVDPGTSGYTASGQRSDAISGASNFANSIFQTPALGDVGVLGGLGTNPQLNALLGNGGLWGHLDRLRNPANYSGGGVGGTNSFTGPYNNPAGTVTNDYTNFTPEDWAQFGQAITVPDLTYDSGSRFNNNSTYNSNVGQVGGFGSAISSHDLYTGKSNQLTNDEILEMLGFDAITGHDQSLLGQDLLSGIGSNPYSLFNTPAIPAIEDVDFWDTWGFE